MEILFPAGNKDYVDGAIECKANAVYGGLKLWNARNKATNFTVEELKETIKLCHNHNIKFYLTLNTLLFDEEIQEIIELLKNENFRPDAIICTDLGLINNLKKFFKEIPLHISTQFGACSIQDTRAIKKLGASRIILARELTEVEINKIASNVDIEIEIFVWGSQCISFSGSCFLGSLFNGGTANRGKCITFCRDKYLCNEKIGNYLYVPDLNCVNYISKIKNLTSIKIEGRRRDIPELQNVVYQIRGLEKIGTNNGYIISSDLNKNKLSDRINLRQKLYFKVNQKTKDKNDVFVKVDDKGLPINFVFKTVHNCFYIYTEIKNKFNPEQINISFDIEQKGGIVSKILFLNHRGEAKYFYNCDNEKEIIPLNVFKKKIEKINSSINIYRIYYKKEFINQRVNITRLMLNNVTDYINKLYFNEIVKRQLKSTALNDIIVESEKKDIILKLSSLNIKTIYNLKTIKDLENVKPIEFNTNVIFKLPFFNFESKSIKQLCRKLKNKEVMFTKYSQACDLANINFKRRYVDYLIPIWNKSSLQVLEYLKVDVFCSSPEISIEKNRQIFENKSVMHLVAGYPICVFTRGCFKKALGCSLCSQNNKNIKNFDRHIDFCVKCYSDHRELTYKRPILNNYSEKKEKESFRYITNNESLNEILKIVNTLRKNNYYKKIKKIKNWNKSYQNNLKEDESIYEN